MTKEVENMQPRSGIATLADLRKGGFVDDLSDAIAEVTTAVIAHKKAGTITIKLAIKPCESAENALFIQDDIKASPPREVKPVTLMFSDEEGSLTREDPQQPNLDLGAEIKVVRINDKQGVK